MSFLFRIFLAVSIAAIAYSCTPKPFAATNKQYKKHVKQLAKTISNIPKDSLMSDSMKLPENWVGTTNYGLRKPNIVIIHHTGQKNCEETLKSFTINKSQVSAHYVICKDGTLFHTLNDYLRAWHAGVGKWGGQSDINSSSIGIEIDNDGKEVFTEAQLNCLLGLLKNIKKIHNIPTANFIGHAEIAPSRKVDPNINFPWKRLAENGFGFWYDDTTGIEIPDGFNTTYALRIIGYDINNLPAATQSFRRHFLSVDQPGEFTEPEKKVLFMLMKKYL